MRSVTFADEKIVDELNSKFVVCWNNHNPESRSGSATVEQPKFTREELEAYPEGGGGGNVRSYVCLPDGRVTHYIEGWYSAERLMDELTFARSLDENNPAARHDEHAKKHREAHAKIQVPGNLVQPGLSPEFRRKATLGLLTQVHENAKSLLLQSIENVLDQVRLNSTQKEFA